MNVEHPLFEREHKLRGQDAHKARQNDQVGGGGLNQRLKCRIKLFTLLKERVVEEMRLNASLFGSF